MKITKNNILEYLTELKSTLKLYGVEEVALFGSYATDNQTVYSDIDIAIKKEKDFLKNHSPYDYFELVNLIKRNIRKKLHRNSDVFDIDSSSTFKDSIKKELIYV